MALDRDALVQDLNLVDKVIVDGERRVGRLLMMLADSDESSRAGLEELIETLERTLAQFWHYRAWILAMIAAIDAGKI